MTKTEKKPKTAMGWVFHEIFKTYPRLMPITIVCILISAGITAIPSIFMENIFGIVEAGLEAGQDWATVGQQVIPLVLTLGGLYAVSILIASFYQQAIAIMGQGSLMAIRNQMFASMQKLPIRYFDTHKHGDIMSYYTNDVDMLRQLIAQVIPHALVQGTILICVFFIMLYYSIPLACIVVGGSIIMTLVSRKFGHMSSMHFIRNQKYMGAMEGYIQEMMNGQKVIKVFNHEEEALKGFTEISDKFYNESKHGNRFANMLMPLVGNMGNIIYVAVAFFGGWFLITGFTNVSLSGSPFSIAIVVAFLQMTRQFSNNVTQISSQLGFVIMAMAGADRIFTLVSEEPEVDDGYVDLVNATEKDGQIIESKERTGIWAWKHPHHDGTLTYTKLEGDVRFVDVDFGYVPEKIVLHDISLYAEPGQKVAFVGSTGAGKTTITNLINRFYDIPDGKIRYDGININKMKKSALRRSLGMVLQDTNLFTGTIMDNIRYGNTEATDDECIAAAKMVGADQFIMQLPDKYQTFLTGNGAMLSQGQRQLLSIARAAVADPPVMILDEATSSIDTRTEEIVQRGMDALMQGRTVFVIAHRLSTVRNSNVIMVLDHGRIIERGTHEQLLALKGTYYKLYTGAFELD